MSESGIGAMIQVGAWLDVQLNVEVLSVGRSVHDVEDCVLEAVGKWLFYRVALAGDRILLSAQLADCPSEPQLILRTNDTNDGWRTVLAIARALEEEDVRSLERPIELRGGSGPDGWVIG